jgi:hypothetical protein
VSRAAWAIAASALVSFVVSALLACYELTFDAHWMHGTPVANRAVGVGWLLFAGLYLGTMVGTPVALIVAFACFRGTNPWPAMLPCTLGAVLGLGLGWLGGYGLHAGPNALIAALVCAGAGAVLALAAVRRSSRAPA